MWRSGSGDDSPPPPSPSPASSQSEGRQGRSREEWVLKGEKGLVFSPGGVFKGGCTLALDLNTSLRNPGNYLIT